MNILSLGGGASISWTSPYLSLLQSEDKSPLGKAISASEASWIGSLLAIGALSGSFFFGWLSEKFGRFRALNFAAVPQIVSAINGYGDARFEKNFRFRFGGSLSSSVQALSGFASVDCLQASPLEALLLWFHCISPRFHKITSEARPVHSSFCLRISACF